MTWAFVTIAKHTTASKPAPHVLYVVEVYLNGSFVVIERRYSEFVVLHNALGDEFNLPPKRLLATSLFPAGWVDDLLIAERKAGLAKYLSAILWSSEYQNAPALVDFLKRSTVNSAFPADLEDCFPSTLSRKKALAVARMLPSATLSASSGDTFLACAYYAAWSGGTVPPESIDYNKYDVLFFAFATPNSTSTLDWEADASAVLKRVVHSVATSGARTKVVLSIGGSEGSQWFSYASSTAITRVAFVETIVKVVAEYGLDGVNIDWEFPNMKGNGNPYMPEDAANLLSLFVMIRSALDSSKIISAAVNRSPWLGANGFPLSDVSAFAEELDFINIMNYGANLASIPASHSPLANVRGNARYAATAEAAVAHWVAAGFPESKILLGIPLFGYVFKSRKTSLSSGSNFVDGITHSSFAGAHKEILPKTVLDGNHPDNSLMPWRGMQIPFRNLVKSGALVKHFDGNYGQGDGYTLAWDDASATPYLFNIEKRALVTFDNTRSVAAKVHFVKATGLAGCCTWSLDQDDGTTLQDVVLSVLGRS
ncbi:glycoside hydrolase family 18 protein [Pholiota conissans]|uniref:Glycoside hydrolase family 18 protein n=1 Tax=Pholiota conissans TaxID=109636 RepID=A0A9P5ZCY6_9AGAR|nr:glycoside hydrolase family 18 protein [Pholiota conissans]